MLFSGQTGWPSEGNTRVVGNFHDSILSRSPNEVSCHASKNFYRALYGADFLAMAWTPFTPDLQSTETIFNLTLQPAADCLFWTVNGYNEDKTKLINSKLRTSSALTMESLRQSDSLTVQAAVSVAAQYAAASIESTNLDGYETGSSTTEQFTYFLRTVDVIDLKARISTDKPPLNKHFNQWIRSLFDNRINDSQRKSRLLTILSLYPFYLKEMWAGSSFAQVRFTEIA